jgi:hypothetical protein
MPVTLKTPRIPVDLIEVAGNWALRIKPLRTGTDTEVGPLYLGVNYTKGSEADVTFTFSVAWKSIGAVAYTLPDPTNPLLPYTVTVTGTSARLIPFSVPVDADEVLVLTTLPVVAAGTGTADIFVTADGCQVV